MHEVFLNEIIAWYLLHKRDLPWRNTQDPYLIWLSEIILQQTRVNQGLPYFIAFSEKYPTIIDFANTPIDEILRTWQGLGYYSRARNMHHTAQLVRDQYMGKFPTQYEELRKLKGIGSYTAAAISSFVANEKRAVVDGNVYRVLSRFWGIEEPINSSKGMRIINTLAQDLISHTTHNGIYNQAIMEFGAMHCKPVAPLCHVCPLEHACVARQRNMTNIWPIKLSKTKVKERELHYLVLIQDGKIYMKKRGAKDIWEGLYDFQEVTASEVPATAIHTSKIYIHKLTHQRLQIRFYICKDIQFKHVLESSFTLQECGQLPKPIIINQFFEDHAHLLNTLTHEYIHSNNKM